MEYSLITEKAFINNSYQIKISCTENIFLIDKELFVKQKRSNSACYAIKNGNLDLQLEELISLDDDQKGEKYASVILTIENPTTSLYEKLLSDMNASIKKQKENIDFKNSFKEKKSFSEPTPSMKQLIEQYKDYKKSDNPIEILDDMEKPFN